MAERAHPGTAVRTSPLAKGTNMAEVRGKTGEKQSILNRYFINLVHRISHFYVIDWRKDSFSLLYSVFRVIIVTLMPLKYALM